MAQHGNGYRWRSIDLGAMRKHWDATRTQTLWQKMQQSLWNVNDWADKCEMSSHQKNRNNTAIFAYFIVCYQLCTPDVCVCVCLGERTRSFILAFFSTPIVYISVFHFNYTKYLSQLHRCAIINSLFICNACALCVHFYYCARVFSPPTEPLSARFVLLANTISIGVFASCATLFAFGRSARPGRAVCGSVCATYMLHHISVRQLCSPFLMSFSIPCNLLMLQSCRLTTHSSINPIAHIRTNGG